MPNKKYSKELLEPIVKRSKSVAEMLRELNLAVKGGNFATIKRNIKKFNLDTSHFTGPAWSRGLTKETSKSVYNVTTKNTKYTPETAFIDGISLGSNCLHRLFNELNIEEKCEDCGCLNIWNNKPIVLHIDHINGNNQDNRLENLRYLCPNCHSQTDTYTGRNVKYKISKDRKKPVSKAKKYIPISDEEVTDAISTSENIRQVLIKLNLNAQGANYQRVKRLMAKSNVKFIHKNNSQYGTRWINDGIKDLKVKSEELDSYLNDGWKLGRFIKPRPPSTKGRIYVTNGKTNKFITQENYVLEDGWIFGRIMFPVE